MMQVQLTGITKNDLQEIYTQAVKNSDNRPSIMFIDAAYIYTFNLEDFNNVRQFNLLGRYYAQKLKTLNKRTAYYNTIVEYNSGYCNYWHSCLEQWYEGKQANIGGRMIKPLQIDRTLDLVVNDGLELLAGAICGEGDAIMEFRGIGDGDISEPALEDHDLYNEVDTINVNETPEGGSLSRDGTTIFSIGNHSKGIPTPDNGEFTECAMFDDDDATKRTMFEHSAFANPIEHEQNADAPGSTSIIYMCSS